jgi:uncharacterized membrane protein
MIYLKSVLNGLAALVITTALIIGIAFGGPLLFAAHTPPGNGGGWNFLDPWVPLWLIAAVPLLVFMLVCMLTFRRLSRAKLRRY